MGLIDLPFPSIPMEPEPAPFQPDSNFGCPSDRIVYWTIANWRVLDSQSLERLSGYSTKQISRAICELKNKDLIKSIGTLEGREVLVLGGKKPQNVPLMKRERPMYKGPNTEVFTVHLITSRGYKVNRHAYWTARVAAWICHLTTTRMGKVCLTYPETVLRNWLGWFWDHPKNDRSWFHTPVPDAWCLMGQIAFRLEVQFTPKSPSDYKRVIDARYDRELVLYVSPSPAVLTTLHTMQDDGEIFGLIESFGERDFDQWWSLLATWSQTHGVVPDPMRDHYFLPGFRTTVQNPQMDKE